MTIDEINVGDVILVPVRIGSYPGEKHLREFQKLVRATLGSSVVYLGEEELKHAERYNPKTEES